MKILISYESRLRPDSTAVYFQRAFEQMGHKVDHVLPEQVSQVTPGNHDLYLKVDSGVPSPWNPKFFPSHYVLIDTHLDVVFRMPQEHAGNFTSISCVHKSGLDLPWKCQNKYWLPVACDPIMHYDGPQEKKHSIAFIGNFHSQYASERVDMVDAAFRAAPDFFFGQRFFKDMARKYAESKIVFNKSLAGDMNMRCFEALCSGSLLLTDRVPDLVELGAIEKSHFWPYTTREDLERDIPILLSQDAMREKIATAGRQFVLKHHKYTDRCETILSKIKELECLPR